MNIAPVTRHYRLTHEWAVHRWPGREPACLFLHATGFHGRCWDEVIRRLDGQACFAVDLPSHGESERWPPPYNWERFGDELAALLGELPLRGALGVGHSIGGWLLTWAAAEQNGVLHRLLLLDPVICREQDLEQRWPAFAAVTNRVARRRSHWDSTAALETAYRDRPPYANWDPAVFADYCAHALRADPERGGWQLRCPGAIEGEVYRGQNMGAIYARASGIDVPVTVIRARVAAAGAPFDFADSPTDPELARSFANGQDEHWGDATHFFPMEQPERLAARLRRELVALSPSAAEETCHDGCL